MDDVDDIFENANVDTSVQVPKKVPEKKRSTGTGSGSGLVLEKVASKSNSAGGKPAAEKLKSPAAVKSSKPISEPGNKQSKKRSHAKTVNTDPAALKRQKLMQDERREERREKEKAAMADFVACARVGRLGAEAFKELEELIAEKTIARLQENRRLKAELGKLSGIQKQLDEANSKAGDQEKKIAEILMLQAELQTLRDTLVAVEAEKKKNAEEIEEVKKDKASLTDRVAIRAVAGFNRYLQMAVILELTLDTTPLKVANKAEDGKIVFKGQVLYDLASVSSPGVDQVDLETEAVEDEGNPAAADQKAVEAEGEKNAKNAD